MIYDTPLHTVLNTYTKTEQYKQFTIVTNIKQYTSLNKGVYKYWYDILVSSLDLIYILKPIIYNNIEGSIEATYDKAVNEYKKTIDKKINIDENSLFLSNNNFTHSGIKNNDYLIETKDRNGITNKLLDDISIVKYPEVKYIIPLKKYRCNDDNYIKLIDYDKNVSLSIIDKLKQKKNDYLNEQLLQFKKYTDKYKHFLYSIDDREEIAFCIIYDKMNLCDYEIRLMIIYIFNYDKKRTLKFKDI